MPIQVSRPFPFSPPVPVPRPVNNWKDIADQLAGTLTSELQKILPEVQADLQVVSQEIAPILVSAVAAGDTKLKDELIAQLAAIAEIYNIRKDAAAWRVMQGVFGVVVSALSLGVGAAVKAATGGAV